MGASRWWLGPILCLMAAPGVWAGQYVLQSGQTQLVPISARVLNGEQVCHLEIIVPGQPPVGRVVRAPFFDTRIVITPGDEESVTVRWRGQFKRDGDQLINACPTQGESRFRVVKDNTQTKAFWMGMLAQLSPANGECLRIAFGYEKVRPEWFDFSDPQRSAEDARIQRAFAQCDAFLAAPKAWGNQNPAGHACSLAGGIQTRCEGIFSAPIRGKPEVISLETAIHRQLEGLPWTTGVREIAGVRTARIKAEQDRVAKLAAQEAARVKAIEDERLRLEREAQEAKLAEQRAVQEKIEALRAQIAEEKALKEKQRLENRNWLLKQVDKLRGSNQPAPAEASTVAPLAGDSAAPATPAATPASSQGATSGPTPAR